MRRFRPTAKPKQKSGAKVSEGSIKNGASLISAVASDLAMAKREGFEKYVNTKMESTLSSGIPNMRPLQFSKAEATFNRELVQGPEGEAAVAHKTISKAAAEAAVGRVVLE